MLPNQFKIPHNDFLSTEYDVQNLLMGTELAFDCKKIFKWSPFFVIKRTCAWPWETDIQELEIIIICWVYLFNGILTPYGLLNVEIWFANVVITF